MIKEVTKQMEQEAEVLKALAHPSRVYIVRALLHKDCCVMELTEALGVEMPTVSRHLSVLKNNGIVDCRREKNQNFYYLKCKCIGNLFDCITHLSEH